MSHALGDLLAQLRADRSEATDAELVAAFVADRDEGAFAELVRRHGPMVLAACRRIVHADVHAAEDAFQAVFLVLATKARTVYPPGRVGAWLYGVAIRVARKAKSWVNKLPTTDVANLASVAQAERPSPDGELREAIDNVLMTLPEKYRNAIVVCDLEGRSREDAAVALGWTEGTLSGRLARARKLLADRLARRGFAPAVVGPSAIASALTAQAVPPHLSGTVLQIARNVAAGLTAEIPARVIELSHGAVEMSRFWMKAVGASVVLAGGFTLLSLFAANPPPSPPELPPAREKLGDVIRPAESAWVAGPGFSVGGRVTALAIAPGAVFVGDDQGHITLWDIKTGKRIETLKMGTDGGGQETIDGLFVSRDGKQYYMILNRGGGMHQASVRQEGRDYAGFGDSGRSVYYGVTGDSKHWLARKSTNNELIVSRNDPIKGKFEDVVMARFVHAERVTHAAGDANVVVSVSGLDKITLRCWKLDQEKAVWEADLGGADVAAVVVSNGGKRVAVTGEAGLVRVFDAGTGKLVSKVDGISGTVSAAAFNHDGTWLVVGCRDGSARVVDTETGKVLTALKGHSDRVLSVAIGLDGEVTTGGADKLVKVWTPRK